ncbi:MAG: glutathione peroxidase [Bacteroidota bacterium]
MKKILLTACGVFILFSCQSNAQETKTTEGTETKEKKEAPPASGILTESDYAAPIVDEISEKKKTKEISMGSIYGFKVKDIDGKEFDFGTLKGKKILIVNTASNCGYTPQYKELEELYKQNKSKLVIIGFPSNDFGNQEPGTNTEIKAFCTKGYDVTFPMMGKVVVKGKEMSELYQFLTQKSQNGVLDSEVAWNFQKYLIDEKGKLVKMFPSKVSPMSEEIMVAVK